MLDLLFLYSYQIHLLNSFQNLIFITFLVKYSVSKLGNKVWETQNICIHAMPYYIVLTPLSFVWAWWTIESEIYLKNKIVANLYFNILISLPFWDMQYLNFNQLMYCNLNLKFRTQFKYHYVLKMIHH